MRAIAVNEWGGRDRLELLELPDPKVGPDTVLIRAGAAGVNPVDAKIRAGNLAGAFPFHFPVVMGWDTAGVVERVGPAVTGFAPGDAVYAYCRKPSLEEGTYAELVAAPESFVARRPEGMPVTAAAAIPLAGLTAYQALVETAAIREGETVLVHAAAGGVGSFAVQIAAGLGARVIATASTGNHDYVGGLGAAWTVDYGSEDVADAIRAEHPDGIDAVLDPIGGEVQSEGLGLLRDGGRLVSIADPPDLSAEQTARGLTGHYVFVRPSGGQLTELTRMAEDGRLSVSLERVWPLDRAADAHERLEMGHVRGKLALSIE